MDTLDQEKLSYISYLKINELLSLQNLQSAHHDEMLFILIHQVYELWFKEILHEISILKQCLDQDNVPRSLKVLHRIETIQKVLLTQLDVLETMTPNEFAEFRDKLRPASGFQSLQFRQIEFMGGMKNPWFLQVFGRNPEAKASLEKLMREKTLFDYVLGLLKKRGFDIPDEIVNRDFSAPYQSHEKVLDALEKIYQEENKYYELYLLCEALMNFDENFSLWRFHHVMMVKRTIGTKPGTGGSSGADYLTSTLEGSFFPDLWAVRNRIGSY